MPSASDNATITNSGTYAVTINTAASVSNVLLGAPVGRQTLALPGGTLALSGTATSPGGGFISMAGGTIKGGTIKGTNTLVISGQSAGGTLDGVALNLPMGVELGQNVTVTAGLTLNSVMTIASGRVHFMGNQTLSGTGEVVNSGNFNIGLGTLDALGSTLTIGPGLTLHGRGGSIQPDSGTIINQGTIFSDVTGGTIYVGRSGSSFTNIGTLAVTNGATLTIQGDTSSDRIRRGDKDPRPATTQGARILNARLSSKNSIIILTQ